jgi:hypothetical protein
MKTFKKLPTRKIFEKYFQSGDIVSVTIRGNKIDRAEVYYKQNKKVILFQNEETGSNETELIDERFKYGFTIYSADGGKVDNNKVSNLTFISRSPENLMLLIETVEEAVKDLNTRFKDLVSINARMSERIEVLEKESTKTTPAPLTKEELLNPTINIAVNPQTREENNLLREWYTSKNKHSLDGNMAADKFYDRVYGDGHFNHTAWMNDEGTYCNDSNFYKESGYKVITVQEFFKILFN